MFIKRGHGFKKKKTKVHCSKISVLHVIYQICHNLLNDSMGTDIYELLKNYAICWKCNFNYWWLITDVFLYWTNYLTILVPYQTFSSVVRRAKKKKKKVGQSLWCLVIVEEDFRGNPLSLRGLTDTQEAFSIWKFQQG